MLISAATAEHLESSKDTDSSYIISNNLKNFCPSQFGTSVGRPNPLQIVRHRLHYGYRRGRPGRRRSVSETLKKGTRVTGVDRGKLATTLRKRYDSGESIRSLAASTGRSYGFVHRILTETGVRLRSRSGSNKTEPSRSRRGRADDADQPQLPIQIFLADAEPGPAVEEA